jgi:hypothetical protein
MGYRFVGLTLLFALVGPLHAQNAGVEFFEKKIRPVLVEHCYECHAVSSKKVRGGLLLDSRDGTRKGGFTGPAVVPGDLAKSLLIKAVHYTDPDMKMPKKAKLPAAIIADLEAWVKMGAPDPRDKAPVAKTAKSWDEIAAERRKWWSLQPVKKLAPPTPKNVDWSHDPIDRFLLSAMEAKGLSPAPDADPRVLIRRLSLVLTGLPATAEEVNEFVKAWGGASAKRQAVEALVDRLLASPHFGERWARHWMDVVRFTETHGNEWNYEVHHAWRYRDYLIRAFNDDVPYDQFVREHIAGDLLPKPRFSEGAARTNESLIGTAFYRFGEVNHDDCIDLRSIGYDLADNQIDTMTKAFQAMTVACARCHDHKLDAISMRDYHGLLGILRSSRQVAHTIDAPDVNAETMRKMRELKKAIRVEMADAWLKQMEVPQVAKMLASLKGEKLPFEHPLAPWQQVASKMQKDKQTFVEAWKAVSAEYSKEITEREKFNEQFVTFADFRNSDWPREVRAPITNLAPPPRPRLNGPIPWQIDGHGLRGGPAMNGDFTVARAGDKAVAAVLPPGAFTHALSEKLNGALRSPLLSSKHKYISFQILGEHASAVRLVSSNCQLNYRNYRYLNKNELHSVTFPIPEEADSLRVYAELMTKFDNPKFPDQLGQLGGGKDFRVPWEQAAADPRSHFGITQVVLHDQPAPPKNKLSHFFELFGGPPVDRLELLEERYRDALDRAVVHLSKGVMREEDVPWLNAFLQSGFLKNRADLTPKLAKLIADYRKLDEALVVPRVVPGMADSGSGYDQPIFIRGDCMRPSVGAPRSYVEVLLPNPIKTNGSGRLELADAIASPDNPLTARVMVNRVWHHLFGNGLVRTADDFGHVGELPSHPELLDYLADQFVTPPNPPLLRGGKTNSPPLSKGGQGGYGWSIKKLIRTIVLTRAFQMSHTPSAAMLEIDPENRLLARYPARRMEAEAIRDSLLFTSGRLDRTLYGLSIPAYREKEYADRRLFKGPLDGNSRRSIYIKVTLMEAPKFLDAFNFPGGKVCQGRRDVTNTPAQALAMLNDPFVHGQADVWAKRLIERKGDTVATRIDAMFRTALGREPRKAEQERFARFVTQLAMLQNVPADGLLTNAAVWRDAGHAMFNLQEFITIP